ncbi:homoserine O- acetyltransferase [Boothiomyces sp. JEL0866]|nr:homoserine O- acetyltransferase [Boothiomyces sp. JEL0866]
MAPESINITTLKSEKKFIKMTAKTKYSDLVQGQTITTIDEFTLESGKVLKNVPVAYKTWGKLNADKSNVLVLCHALSGSCDVEDWWGPLIGPGRTFDTTRFFIFCGNVFGSPYGTASPITINPATNQPYGPNFPQTTIRDDVRVHKLILDGLGVEYVRFVIGGSMGGMQVLEWAFFGDYVKNIVPIATSGRHSAWCISWGEAQRQSIYSDPKYLDGTYEMSDPPVSGLSAARMAAMLTYRSRNSFEQRFGRKVMPTKSVNDHEEVHKLQHNEGNKYSLHIPGKAVEKNDQEFSVYSAQSYLRYKGDAFVNRFDANCYIAITRKLDTHDISRGRGTYQEALSQIQQPTLVIGVDSDGLFTVEEQYELGNGIPNSQVVIIQSGEGHDGFLLEFQQMRDLLSSFIKDRAPELLEQEPIEIKVQESKASVFGEAEGDMLMW